MGVAAIGQQDVPLPLGLDAFRSDSQAVASTQRDDGLDNRGGRVLRLEIRDEAAVDLDARQRQGAH